MTNDDTVARLHSLTDELTKRLTEAQDVRTRFTKAHDADSWPDMRLAAQRLADANRTR